MTVTWRGRVIPMLREMSQSDKRIAPCKGRLERTRWVMKRGIRSGSRPRKRAKSHFATFDWLTTTVRPWGANLFFSAKIKRQDLRLSFYFAWREERFVLSFVALPQMKCISVTKGVWVLALKHLGTALFRKKKPLLFSAVLFML